MSIDITKRPPKRHALGITLFIVSSFFMALMGTSVKLIADHQTAEAIVFWRNLVGFVIVTPWIFFSPPHISITKKLKTTTLKLHLIRGVSSFTSVFLYFYSLKFLDLSSATLLFNTLPIFIPIVGFIWARIVIHKPLWWGIGVAFLGIVFVLHPGKELLNLASLFALLSGMIGAVSYVAVRLGHYTETPARMMFYLFAICMIFAAIATLFSFQASWENLTIKDFFIMLLVGIFGFLYQVALTAAAKYVPMRLGSVFIYFSVIFAMFFDWWIWNVHLPLSMYLGFALIVLGASLLVILYPKDDLNIK